MIFSMVFPYLLFISGLSKWLVFRTICGFCGSALNSKAYLVTALHFSSVCMASITHPLPTWQGSEAQGRGPAGCAILYQACDKQGGSYPGACGWLHIKPYAVGSCRHYLEHLSPRIHQSHPVPDSCCPLSRGAAWNSNPIISERFQPCRKT